MSFEDHRERLALASAVAEARERGWIGPREGLDAADEATRMLIGMSARRLAEGPVLGPQPSAAEQGDAIRERKKDAAHARIVAGYRG